MSAIITYISSEYVPTSDDECTFQENIMLVPYLIDRYAKKYSNDEDLLQKCLLSYWNGIKSYDPETGYTLGTYCGQCIKSAIHTYLRDINTKKNKLQDGAIRLDSSMDDYENDLYDIIADPNDAYAREADKEWAEYIVRSLKASLNANQLTCLNCWERHHYHNRNTALELGVSTQRVTQIIQAIREKVMLIIRDDLSQKPKKKAEPCVLDFETRNLDISDREMLSLLRIPNEWKMLHTNDECMDLLWRRLNSEQRQILTTVAKNHKIWGFGSKAEAAHDLGITQNTLSRKLSSIRNIAWYALGNDRKGQ